MKKFVIAMVIIFCTFTITLCISANSALSLPAFALEGTKNPAGENITKKEADLKKPQTYTDVRGQIANGIYSNDSFGFTMMVNQKGFSAEVSSQEGYKYNFEHPTAAADDVALSVYTGDFSHTLTFYQSHKESHPEATAAAILAKILSKYNPTITEKKLDNKTVAFAQIKDDGAVIDNYAMIVNGFFIRWAVKHESDNQNYKTGLQNIMNSIKFDWVH